MEEVRFYEDVAGPRHGATGLRGETLVTLRAAGLNADDVARAVGAALDEDFAYGPDVTSAATVAGRTVTADVVAREAGVLAGMPVALAVLDLIGCYLDGPAASWRLSPAALVPDGTRLRAGDAVLRVSGPAPAVLGAERTMLNFLTHLSGIATATRAWADAIEGTGAVVRDTRKTTPGLRVLEKYAVRCGGGRNHRMGLGDAALIKDNHVAAAGGVAAAVTAVQSATARSGSAPAEPALAGSAVGGSAVGGSAVGGSAVGGSAVGGSAVGGSAVGGSAVGGSVGCGRFGCAAGRVRGWWLRSSAIRWGRFGRRLRRGRISCCSTTCRSARCGRRWRWPASTTGCGSRPAAGCGWRTRARSPRPASTTCRWGR